LGISLGIVRNIKSHIQEQNVKNHIIFLKIKIDHNTQKYSIGKSHWETHFNKKSKRLKPLQLEFHQRLWHPKPYVIVFYKRKCKSIYVAFDKALRMFLCKHEWLKDKHHHFYYRLIHLHLYNVSILDHNWITWLSQQL